MSGNKARKASDKWSPKKHLPSEFALVSNFFPNFFQRLFPNFSKEFGKIGFGKKIGKKWFSPAIQRLDRASSSSLIANAK
jgi:hypothetical protein